MHRHCRTVHHIEIRLTAHKMESFPFRTIYWQSPQPAYTHRIHRNSILLLNLVDCHLSQQNRLICKYFDPNQMHHLKSLDSFRLLKIQSFLDTSHVPIARIFLHHQLFLSHPFQHLLRYLLLPSASNFRLHSVYFQMEVHTTAHLPSKYQMLLLRHNISKDLAHSPHRHLLSLHSTLLIHT